MVWIETPTNPLLKLVDIQGASEIVHQNEVSVTLTVKIIITVCHIITECSVIPCNFLRGAILLVYLCDQKYKLNQ